MKNSLIRHLDLLKRNGKKALAILFDPDKAAGMDINGLLEQIERYDVDMILVGGSLVKGNEIHDLIADIKEQSEKPVILFPGSPNQISDAADGILLLSLISGRNPELLIGRHVEAAPLLYQTDLEILPTGYMLIDSGAYTTAHYVSNTLPIPHDKPQIAVFTAMAGEMLGLKLIYMDGGSGAKRTVSEEMIRQVSEKLTIPLIVGGGIRSAEKAREIWAAGADIIVIGTAMESEGGENLIEKVSHVKRQFSLNGKER
ncbi:MAG: geranylgeranylglyceryl/heptaprenylglyceryl phosphate synthase [Bacteroidetes bacterium]|nr:geranylgeranylglyceryl/heptaprenylglyceryl phosphate synthase [Bacteroidota bacterium]